MVVKLACPSKHYRKQEVIMRMCPGYNRNTSITRLMNEIVMARPFLDSFYACKIKGSLYVPQNIIIINDMYIS